MYFLLYMPISQLSLRLHFVLLIGFLGIIQSQLQAQESLWGTTHLGGKDNAGTIYRTTPDGDSIYTVYEFKVKYQGKTANGELLQTPNGNFYGVTVAGGPNDQGVLYSYNPNTKAYKAEVIFERGPKGARPVGKLVKAANGKLYGVTKKAGAADSGVLYRYNPQNGQYKKLVDFTNGGYPRGGLIEAPNGSLYGMTFRGGGNGAGIIFKYNPANQQYQKVHEFTGYGGYGPAGRLMQANNGLLYGMTNGGGQESGGVLFAFDPAMDTFQVVHDFDEEKAGGQPNGSLIQASNGKLYGVLPRGEGIRKNGAIFSYDPAKDSFRKIRDFFGTKGGEPVTRLIEVKPNVLYGVCNSVQDPNNRGAIFKYHIGRDQLSFPKLTRGRYNEAFMLGQDGKLYHPEGGIYSFDTASKQIQREFEFQQPLKGKGPESRLLRTDNNQLYGITAYGGKHGDGVLFRYDPYQQALIKEVDFKSKPRGANPRGDLMQADNGNIYGLTTRGGNGTGVIFSFDPQTDSFTKESSLGYRRGSNPQGGLVQAQNGKLYGLASEGGTRDDGALFVYNIQKDTAKALFSFRESKNKGIQPNGSLLETRNGNLYGVAPYGGKLFFGTMFKYNYLQDTMVKVRDFGNSKIEGGRPTGSLMQSPTDGKIYGIAQEGPFNQFRIFSYDETTDSFVSVEDTEFYPTYPGDEPTGILLEADNQKFYGICKNEGVGRNDVNGLMYQFDPSRKNPAQKTVTTAFNFADTNFGGQQPRAGLIQFRPPKLDTQQFVICAQDSIQARDTIYKASGTYYDTFKASTGADSIVITQIRKGPFYDTVMPTLCSQYTYPETGRTFSESGTYKDTFTAQSGCDSIAVIQLTIGNTADTISDTACYQLTVPSKDETYTASGTYQDTLTNAADCDSLLTINLTITDSSSTTLDTTVCAAYTLPSGSRTYQNSGTYEDTLTNEYGCDSLITVNLTVPEVDTSVSKTGDTLQAGTKNAAYQWLDCSNGDSAIASATSRQFIPDQSGDYAVAVSRDGCTDTSSCYTVQPVGLDERINPDKLRVYPNPAQDHLTVKLPETMGSAVYRLQAVKGQLIKTGQLKGSFTRIPLGDVLPGVYMLTVQTNNAVFQEKVVIE